MDEKRIEPVLVTNDSIDPLFKEPYVDVDELRHDPQPHRYVHGGFKDTEARFSLYFPPARQYQRRFHHNTYPLATSEDIGPFPIAFDVATGNLGFSLESGAYYVQTNMGGAFRRGDPSVAAYRVNAAAAKFSRTVAGQIYGPHRPFGYLYGGSGGAYQTIGAAEHTDGVWDGFMPFVLGCNNAVPSLWSVRLHALRVLRKRNSFPAVMDAINPGGSGDMYAPLNDEEREALREATLMGFPPRGWYNHEMLHHGYFSDVYGAIPALDPSYADDFWTKPGYLGSDPQFSPAADRFQFGTTVARVIDGPSKRVALTQTPDHDLGGAHLLIETGAMAGKTLHISRAEGNVVSFATTSDPAVLKGIQAGDGVRINNFWLLAAQTYQRHQVPSSDREYGWNQFRDSAGEPLYPQRDILIGHFFALNSVGALLDGSIHGKMLLVQALMDVDALAWGADWYRAEVEKALGTGFGNQFALWFIDHAQHDNPSTDVARAHTVKLEGPLQQGLRDLSRWVEDGIRPADTAYRMDQAQVEVPRRAAERRGIQPVVHLQVNRGTRADISPGEAVAFTALVEVPPDAGKVVAIEWDFEGRGVYAAHAEVGEPQTQVQVSASHTYLQRGTYYPVLRATSQREGNAGSPYARIQNIGRVRVVVA